MNDKTLIINSFAGPGAGKSTFSGMLFGRLKLTGYNVEYVQEFAKELTWKKDFVSLSDQPYVTCTQLHRQNILLDQVQAIITDSPILIGLMYGNVRSDFADFVIQEFFHQNNLNFFLNRKKDYNESGRTQTLEEAIQLDDKIKCLLRFHRMPFIEIESNENGFYNAFEIVKRKLDEKNNK